MVSCLVPVGFANQALLDKGNTTFWSLVRGNEMVHCEAAHTSTETGWMMCGQETSCKTLSLYSCPISNHSGWLAMY
jgi:hypothetical protein